MNALMKIVQPSRGLVFNPAMLIIAGYLLTAGIALQDYLALQLLNGMLGLIALAFVGRYHSGGRPGYGWAWLAVVLIVLCILLPVKTFFYFAIASALLFTVGCFYGSPGLLPFFVLALMSPVFQYITDTFSFPIRLAMSRLAGTVFNAAGVDTTVRGNLIIRDSSEFSVDPGCMGLSMMEASLLLGVMLVAFFQHRFERKLSTVRLLLYFTLIFLLNIAANLFRILILVHFFILPATPAHEAAGLWCLLLYVFIPAVFISRWWVRRLGYRPACPPVTHTRRHRLVAVILLIALAGVAVYMARTDTYRKIDLSRLQYTGGYTAALTAPGVVKLEGQASLVYIKYIRGFYDTDHSPMICWKGSGYTFGQVEQEQAGGHTIYTALLDSGTDRLYSAWWYSNGSVITTNQLTWRWNMLKHQDHYAVVNVTCATKAELDTAVLKIIGEKTLQPFFKQLTDN